jgi:hypothetical protein
MPQNKIFTQGLIMPEYAIDGVWAQTSYNRYRVSDIEEQMRFTINHLNVLYCGGEGWSDFNDGSYLMY